MKSHAVSGPGEYPRFVDAYLPALLAQAHELVASEFHAVAAQHGLAPTEWRVLATLANAEPTSIGRLAQVVVMKQPTVTRLLDRMEANGLVQRQPHEVDRRITLVCITTAGQTLTKKLVPLAREHEERVLAPFGVRRANALKDTLAQLIGSHRGAEETPA